MRLSCTALLVMSIAASATGVPAAQSIVSGGSVLNFPKLQGGGYGLALTAHADSGTRVIQAAPAAISTCGPCSREHENTDPVVTSGAYSSITSRGGSVVATAIVTSADRSRFRFTDIYSANTQGFSLSRRVTVVSAGGGDVGFASLFSFGFEKGGAIATYHFLAPGIWYDHNADVTAKAFGSELRKSWIYWREMRSGLPFVMMQDDHTGLALSLAHTLPAPSSGVDEASQDWLTDASIQYGSLGVQGTSSTAIGFMFPASEGDGTYVGNRSTRWVRRSHPVTTGFTHAYTLTLRLTQERSPEGNADFALALKDTWRAFYPAFIPPLIEVPGDTVYSDGIALANHYFANRSGAPGLPFLASLPDGHIPPGYVSYQMGFVGEQLPLGYQLLRYGIEHDDPASRSNGFAIVDFWAKRAAQSNGLPFTWYNVAPPTFRDNNCASPIFLRTASDGMEGALQAAQLMREQHQPVPEWESFVTAYGDWLVAHQNADGSFYRAFNPDGSVFNNAGSGCNRNGYGTSKSNTTHPIRFLVELYFASGDTRFLTAAVRAGQFSYANFFEKNSYVGGTPDNGNTIDKEAAVEALHAFLSLYDATGTARWLDAANGAADFVETWMYAWNFGLKDAPPDFTYAGEQGSGLIATGHSGADAFLNFEVYDMYRLHLFGDDANNHRLAVAQYLATNSKMTTQLTGVERQQFGDAYNGLLREANDFSTMRYKAPAADAKPAGSNSWLPWLTEAEIEPLQLLKQNFKSTSISVIEQQSVAERQQENTHTHVRPGSLGWNTRSAPKSDSQ